MVKYGGRYGSVWHPGVLDYQCVTTLTRIRTIETWNLIRSRIYLPIYPRTKKLTIHKGKKSMRACRGRPVSGRGTLRQRFRRGRKAHGSPPLLTRAALPAGHRPAWPPRATPEAEASERTASEFHPQPRQRRGQPPPAQAAPSRVSGGAVAEAGAATRSGARVSVAARQRRAYGGKPRKGGQRSGGARGA